MNVAGSADAGQVGQPSQMVGAGGASSDAGQNVPPVNGGAGGGTTTPVVDAGPPDLGANSQGDTFFRADTLVLKSPNMYASVPLLGRQDATAAGQEELDKALTLDADSDGFVDMSMLLRFLKTSDPKAGNGTVTPGGAVCPVPPAPDNACGPDKTFPFQSPVLEYVNNTQACTLEGAPETAAAPCFATKPASLTMQLPILGAVPLEDGQIIGTWDGANISNGFVRGFLSKTVASATKLGEGVPPLLAIFNIQMGTPLVNFFSDAQMQKNSKGEDGWWVLMSYTAKAAKFDPSLPTP